MLGYVFCFPLHTSHCMVAMTTTGSIFRSLMIKRNKETRKPKKLTYVSNAFSTAEVIGALVNKLTSVFHPSVLLLIMNFVITLSK